MPVSEKHILIKVLEALRDMPHMWDRKHRDYTNQAMRVVGYRSLHNIYRKYDPDTSLKHLKKKLENMRTCYLKEVKKVMASKRAGIDRVYQPTLWYYDAFTFLSPRAPSRTVTKRLRDKNPTTSESDEELLQPAPSSSNSAIKRKESVLITQETVEDPPRPPTGDEDWEILGRSIGLQLRDLNGRELAITQKIISDAIYYAKLGKLTENSRIELGPEPEFLFVEEDFD